MLVVTAWDLTNKIEKFKTNKPEITRLTSSQESHTQLLSVPAQTEKTEDN